MSNALKDRIVAHRSAPDVYDPPSFEDMADRIEELQSAFDNLHREYDKRGARIAELEAEIAGMMVSASKKEPE